MSAKPPHLYLQQLSHAVLLLTLRSYSPSAPAEITADCSSMALQLCYDSITTTQTTTTLLLERAGKRHVDASTGAQIYLSN